MNSAITKVLLRMVEPCNVASAIRVDLVVFRAEYVKAARTCPFHVMIYTYTKLTLYT
jgi:hypothetical protein